MQSLSYGLFIFVLIFSPLAFGTVEHWALAVLEAATALSFVLIAWYLHFQRKKQYCIPGFLPLFILLGWMILQILPLPPFLVKLLSPATYEIYRPLVELDNTTSWIPLSLNPRATLLSFFKFASYGLFYLLTVFHLSKADRLKQTVGIVSSLGIFIAVQAILQQLTSPGLIYWFREGLSTTPMGPWVYRNHFAGFMEMLFPLVTALFLTYRPEVRFKTNLRDKFISLFTMPGSNRHLLLGTGVILMAVSILLSLSRGGIITLSMAFLFFTFFSAWTTSARRIKWNAVIIVVTVLMVTWFGWQPIMERFGHVWGSRGLDSAGRLPVFIDGLGIVRSFPMSGTGFGTFLDIYPAFRTVPGDAVFDHAHNDYLELFTDGGLVGFLLSAWFVFDVAARSVKTLLKRREKYSILITSGALSGLLALLLHSFVDFQIYNGANGLYFFFLCGLAVSGAHTRIQYRTRSTRLKNNCRLPVIAAGFTALIILVPATWYNLAIYRAERTVSPVQTIFLNKNIPDYRLKEMHTLYANAAGHDPLEASYRFRQGQVSLFMDNDKQARQEFLQAAQRRPMSGLYVQQFGLSLPAEQKDTAVMIIELGPDREPRVIERYLTYCRFLLNTGERDRAGDILTRAFLKRPDKASEVAAFAASGNFDQTEITRILPRKAFAWHEMGILREKENRLGDAEMYYLKALDFADQSTAKPSYFSRLYTLYLRQKKQEQALEILRMGVEYLPDYAPFRVQLGDYYLGQGVPYRAKEEYLQALRINPKTRAVQVKVDKLEASDSSRLLESL